MKTKLIPVLLASALLAAAPSLSFAQAAPAAASAAAGPASTVVLDASTRILSTLQQRRAEFRSNPTALRGFINGELTKTFDRDYAARLVLGVHGRGASDADVKLFADAMADNLMQRYGSALLDIQGKPSFRLKSESPLPGNRGVKVSTELVRAGSEADPGRLPDAQRRRPVEDLRRDDRRHLLRADLQDPVRRPAAPEVDPAGGHRAAQRQHAGRPRVASNPASVSVQGTSLVFSGVLDRAAVTALWPSLQRRRRCAGAGPDVRCRGWTAPAWRCWPNWPRACARMGIQPRFNGAPAGFTELSAAYRLAPSLDFNAPSAAS